jgi:formate dehydrogenase iron-sulfur subunit
VGVGLEPACVKTCPTGAIGFGTKDEMVAYGEKRAVQLQERGFKNAGLYNPQGVGGTHVMYVLKHADKPELEGLPNNPSISPMVALWKGLAKPLAVAGMVGAVIAGFFHYMKVGPIEEKDAEEEKTS